jgi:hypothetical protein
MPSARGVLLARYRRRRRRAAITAVPDDRLGHQPLRGRGPWVSQLRPPVVPEPPRHGEDPADGPRRWRGTRFEPGLRPGVRHRMSRPSTNAVQLRVSLRWPQCGGEDVLENVDRFSEGTRPTSIRSGIRRACRADRAAARRPGPAPVRPARADRAPACPPCQCCPRQAFRATPRCLTPRAESCPQSDEVEPPAGIEPDDLLITRRTDSLREGPTACD